MNIPSPSHSRGFALIVTITVLVLLALVAVGLLTLSTITVRSASQGSAEAEARANARLALMLAIGELQKEMGPDMRVSAEAALFDDDEKTPTIEGVSQSHWLASYDAWGDWLNAEYTRPEGGGKLRIQDTYTPRREKMFRRWLLSLPDEMRQDVEAPLSLTGWDDDNSVVLVGPGTLGKTAEITRPNDVTRAYLVPVGQTGKHAWWIGAENHKARIDLAKRPRTLRPDEWEVSQGDSAEVGVGALPGFETLDSDTALAAKLVSTPTLEPAQIAPERVEEHFFDLSAASQGVIASVRTGHLKRDLSLLFEKSSMPAPYRFNRSRDIQEPSIRPMSRELAARDPSIPNRHFQSWTNMRHYYRMYRRDSDATIGEIGGSGSLNWARLQPWTDYVASTNLGNSSAWDGSNHYWRVPILAKITFIYSLMTERVQPRTPERYECFHVYTPVFTYWNPYNVEMRIPDNKISMLTSAYKTWPNAGQFWLGGTLTRGTSALGLSINTRSHLRSGNNRDIIFRPGELKVFSPTVRSGSGGTADLVAGFDPQAIGGERVSYGIYRPDQRPGLAVEFSHSYWGGNINWGNTGGSLCHQSWWNRTSNRGGLPMTYANDWFQKDQTHTPMTPPGARNVARWVFSDSAPVPVAFAQLVLKGLSEFNYESISWAKDWRSRNWIHSPPFYFGSGMYISENDLIAHTQRLDCPYVVFFGPTSMAEMPKVVGHLGPSAFLGSGSNPYEKVTSAAVLELPTAPISGLAGFSNMRINPGWVDPAKLGPHLSTRTYSGNGVQSTGEESLHAAETKRVAYQSGVTGPGIGNSFMHPMLERDDVYHFIDNSKSEDVPDRSGENWQRTITNDSKAYNDYWDHVLLLNDALWDDYFVSSLADQARPGASAARSLEENFDRLVAGEGISNARYRYHPGGQTSRDAKADLQSADGYLAAAKYLMVDGMFNVNSTSVPAWHALFAGIRERQLVMRNAQGQLREIGVPDGKRIALSRFDTEVSGEEMSDPEFGAEMADGSQGWSGVRFLDDAQLLKLAEECVRQVKLRGPFLNFSEFINRRLSDDALGTMGALQSAIDYDDDEPEEGSINYRYKAGPGFMMEQKDLGRNLFGSPETVAGSRFAGIPGYVIQSDLLKPIGNTLAVRDDTFRIRAYGEANDPSGRVLARAWCEAVVQRVPEYQDPANDAEVPARRIEPSGRNRGRFLENSDLTTVNRRFGRSFRVQSFRWLRESEV